MLIEQLLTFAIMFSYGALLSSFYHNFSDKLARYFTKERVVVHLVDFMSVFLSGILGLIIIIFLNYGILRFYYLFAVGLGFLITRKIIK